MARTGRPGMSIERKEKAWKLWRGGESYSEIGRKVGRAPGAIFCFFQKYGGIPPKLRTRSDRTLSFNEREEISRGLASDLSFREIAQKLNRSPSTICREVARHGGKEYYRAIRADMKAWDNAKRSKLSKLQLNRKLCSVVREKLLLKWAPEQISGWLTQKYSSDPSMNISHEAIYRTLFIPSRACLEKSLIRNLRTKRKMRQPRQFNTKGVPRGQSFEHLPIHDRPPEV